MFLLIKFLYFIISFISVFVRVIIIPRKLGYNYIFLGFSNSFLETSAVFIILLRENLINKCFALLAISYTSSAGFNISRKKNIPDCIILDNWVFKKFILSYEPVVKGLQSFENCVWVNNSLYGKLVSSIEFPTKFDERLEVQSHSSSISSFRFWLTK